MHPNNLILAASLVFALTLGSYFVVSPVAKHETNLRLAKIGTLRTNNIAVTKQNTATGTATTSVRSQGSAARN